MTARNSHEEPSYGFWLQVHALGTRLLRRTLKASCFLFVQCLDSLSEYKTWTLWYWGLWAFCFGYAAAVSGAALWAATGHSASPLGWLVFGLLGLGFIAALIGEAIDQTTSRT